MRMKAIVVAGSILAVSASLAAQQGQQGQAQQGARGSVYRDFNRLGFDSFIFGPLESRVIKGAPYSAETLTESIQTLGDGNRIVRRSTGRVYRDAEGRVRREEDRGTSVIVTITDPVADKSYTLDAANRTARESPGLRLLSGYFQGFQAATYGYTGIPFALDGLAVGTRGGRGAQVRDGRNEQVEEGVPNRTIEGVIAAGVRRTTSIPKGAIGNDQPIKIVSEEWTSVDLQVLVLTDFNDPRTGRSTYRLSKINRAEPAAALFKVPADYTLQRGAGRGRGGRR